MNFHSFRISGNLENRQKTTQKTMAAKKLIETARTAEMSAPRRESLGGPDDMTEVGTEWTAAALQQGVTVWLCDYYSHGYQ